MLFFTWIKFNWMSYEYSMSCLTSSKGNITFSLIGNPEAKGTAFLRSTIHILNFFYINRCRLPNLTPLRQAPSINSSKASIRSGHAHPISVPKGAPQVATYHPGLSHIQPVLVFRVGAEPVVGPASPLLLLRWIVAGNVTSQTSVSCRKGQLAVQFFKKVTINHPGPLKLHAQVSK